MVKAVLLLTLSSVVSGAAGAVCNTVENLKISACGITPAAAQRTEAECNACTSTNKCTNPTAA
eukprot:gene5063-20105_t